jgi:hypothetical protein
MLESLRSPYENDESLFLRLISAYQDVILSHKSGISKNNMVSSVEHSNYLIGRNIGYTLSSKKKPFSWDLKNKILTIYRDDLPSQPFDLKDIVNILRDIYSIYGEAFFHLDNNVTDVMNIKPDNQTGLGRMIFRHTKSVSAAQVSSQLGPLLTQCKIFQWNGKGRGIEFQCTPLVADIDVEKLERLLHKK